MKSGYFFPFRIIITIGLLAGLLPVPEGIAGGAQFYGMQLNPLHLPHIGILDVVVDPPSGSTTTEAGGSVTFDVYLDADPGTTVTVNLSSTDTSEGSVSPTEMTFDSSNYSTPQAATVTGVDDAIDDGDQPYTIVITSTLNNPDDIDLTNTDNDTAGVTVDPTSELVTTEDSGTATFTVVLTSEPTADVTINLASSNTSEGTVAPAALTFTAGDWSLSQTVTITGVDDAIDDGDISYTIQTGITSTDPVYAAIDPPDVSVTNTDNDTAGVTVDPTSELVTTEDSGTATFTVVLTSEPTADVTINLASSNTSEGTVAPAALTFTAENWSQPQTVTITGVDDAIDDGDISYTIQTSLTSTDPVYAAIDPPDVSVTNTDDDTAGVTVNPTSGLVTTEDSGTATFTVVLTSEPTADVTINLTSSDISEGTVSPAALTFTAANWSLLQTVTITGVDDFIIDGPVDFTIQTSVTSTDPVYAAIDPPDVSVTNTDNDVAEIEVEPSTGLLTTEGGGTAQFSIVLASQPTANVRITLSSNDPTEATVSTNSLTFKPSTWNTSQTVTVTGVDDDIHDGDQIYTILLDPATSNDSNYKGIDPSDVFVTNADNDEAGFTIVPNEGLITTEGEVSVTVQILLKTRPLNPVILTFESSDTTEGIVPTDPVTITPEGWQPNNPYNLVIMGVDDTLVDGDKKYKVTIRAESGDTDYGGFTQVLNVTNKDAPTITWVSPESDGGIYEITTLAPVLLKVKRVGQEPISKVRFYYWDYANLENVTIGEVSESPYQIRFDPSNLNTQFNQVWAYAFGPDPPGDELPTTSVHKFIWIFRRTDLIYRVFLPIGLK